MFVNKWKKMGSKRRDRRRCRGEKEKGVWGREKGGELQSNLLERVGSK